MTAPISATESGGPTCACGNSLNPSNKFCGECGAAVATFNPPAAKPVIASQISKKVKVEPVVSALPVLEVVPVAKVAAITTSAAIANASTTNTDGNVYGWMVTPLNLPRTLTFPYSRSSMPSLGAPSVGHLVR